jgi:hypothetical protein
MFAASMGGLAVQDGVFVLQLAWELPADGCAGVAARDGTPGTGGGAVS